MNEAKNEIQRISYLEKRLLFILVVFVHFHNVMLASDYNGRAVEVIVADSNVIKEEELINSSIVSISGNMDTLNEDVSQIRQYVESILKNTKEYQKESERNKTNYDEEKRLTYWGLGLSILNIIAVVLIYLLTQQKTKKQIQKQHEDTEKQIKQQHEDTEKLINKMQEHSDERNKKLIQLGEQIQTSTGKIEESVKHLERRSVLEINKPKVTGYCSSLIADYEALCEELERNYNYFVSGQNNDYIHQKASSIKRNILNISHALNSCSEDSKMPDPKAYIESINDIDSKPSLNNKRKQTNTFKEEGKKFNNQLEICIHNNFLNK